jgi:hypothetical protein
MLHFSMFVDLERTRWGRNAAMRWAHGRRSTNPNGRGPIATQMDEKRTKRMLVWDHALELACFTTVSEQLQPGDPFRPPTSVWVAADKNASLTRRPIPKNYLLHVCADPFPAQNCA